ncbi:DUF1772 domain-containing protein [uncultured Pseudokineococcus sp.]|uniref:anthrone oxygenase family protein n=1 Tax=uncultured Pseudokineococcus sp. TaxID=1642928 RepID=UPI002611C559|nr:anthrone oxygenase family protein [uncultured Pseudokineococcus sp.]
MRGLVLAAGIGSALVGGVFFAFSAFVLPALGRLPAADAAAAMRSINVLAVRPPLMVALFGTAAACALTGVLALRRGDGWVAAGSATYLVGVVLVTVAANVPLNDRLAGLQLDVTAYAEAWGRWNHVRTAAGAVAAALLLGPHAADPSS